MIVMIFTAIATMIWTGYLNGGTNLVEDFANCSSSESLVFAGLVTVGFLLLFYLPRRVIGFKDFMNSVPQGGKLMMPPTPDSGAGLDAEGHDRRAGHRRLCAPGRQPE